MPDVPQDEGDAGPQDPAPGDGGPPPRREGSPDTADQRGVQNPGFTYPSAGAGGATGPDQGGPPDAAAAVERRSSTGGEGRRARPAPAGLEPLVAPTPPTP